MSLQASFSPGSIAFGSVNKGRSATVQLAITNAPSAATLSFHTDNPAFTIGRAIRYELRWTVVTVGCEEGLHGCKPTHVREKDWVDVGESQGGLPLAVQAGDYITVDVIGTNTSSGTDPITGTLTISTNGQWNPIVVALTLTPIDLNATLSFNPPNALARQGATLSMPFTVTSQSNVPVVITISQSTAFLDTGLTIAPVQMALQPNQTQSGALSVAVAANAPLGTETMLLETTINGQSWPTGVSPTITIIEPQVTVYVPFVGKVATTAPGGILSVPVIVDLHNFSEQTLVTFTPRLLPRGVSSVSGGPQHYFAQPGYANQFNLQFRVSADAPPGPLLPITMDWDVYQGRQVGIVDIAGKPVDETQHGVVDLFGTIDGVMPPPPVDQPIPMTVVEFQMQAMKMLSFITQQFAAQTLPPSATAAGYALDHFDLGEIALRQNTTRTITLAGPGGPAQLTIPALQVTQDVKVWLVAQKVVTPPVMVARATVVFDFQLGQDNQGNPTLSLSFNHLEGDVLTVAALKRVFAGFSTQPVPFNVGKLLNAKFPTSNFGLAADPSLQRLALRLEAAPPTADSIATWQSFFNGQFDDHLGSNAWSLLLDKSIADSMIAAQVQQSLAKISQLHSYGTVSAGYSVDNGVARVDASVSVEVNVPDPCPALPANISIAVHISSPQGSGVLQSLTNLSFDFPSSASQYCLDLLGGILGSVTRTIASDIIFDGFWWPAAAVGALVGFIAGVLAAAGFLSGYTVSNLGPKCVNQGSNQFLCTQSVNTSGVPLGTLTMTGSAGLIAGLLIEGKV